TNDIPGIFQALVDSAHLGPVEVGGVLYGNTSLEDHWNIGNAQRSIATGHWHLVGLEQGPSARLDSRALLRTYVQRFDSVIKQAGGQTALYMTWPQSVNIADFPASSGSWHLGRHA